MTPSELKKKIDGLKPAAPDYGTVTIHTGSKDERTVKIVNYVETRFKNKLTVSICGLADGSFVMGIEEKNGVSKMHLNRDAFVAFMSTVLLYQHMSDLDYESILVDLSDGKSIEYSSSDNLKQPPHTTTKPE